MRNGNWEFPASGVGDRCPEFVGAKALPMTVVVDHRSLLLSGGALPAGLEVAICAGPFPASRRLGNIVGCSDTCHEVWRTVLRGEEADLLIPLKGATEVPAGFDIPQLEAAVLAAAPEICRAMREYAAEYIGIVSAFAAEVAAGRGSVLNPAQGPAARSEFVMEPEGA